MPALRIGKAEISYQLRRSATASERKIIVTPGRVEVVAPATDDAAAIAGFLRRKRQWVFDTVREMERVTANRHSVPRLMTGSKVLFRGRKISLTVRRTDAERAEVTFRNGVVVDLPNWVGEDADRVVASELKLWMKQRVRRDVSEIAGEYSDRFGLVPKSVRTANFPNGWGSCGPEGNILINWQLIFAPRKVLEYIVVHELAHLRHRSHGHAFWNFLATLMPDYGTPKAWLAKHQSSLSDDFLKV